MPDGTSNTQPTFAWHTRARHFAACLSGVGAARGLAGAPCRASCDRFIPYAKALHRREASLSLSAAVVRRASCGPNVQPTFASHVRTCRCGGCLSGGCAARELAARARRAALAVVGLCHIQKHCPGERPLSFGARPWCDVPVGASNAQPTFAPTFAWHTRAHRCTACLSGVGAARGLAARARSAALVVVGPYAMQKH